MSFGGRPPEPEQWRGHERSGPGIGDLVGGVIRRLPLLYVGVGSFALALAVLFVPLPEPVRSVLASLASRTLVLALGALGLAVVVWAVLSLGVAVDPSADEDDGPSQDDPDADRTPGDADVAVVGAEIEAALDRLDTRDPAADYRNRTTVERPIKRAAVAAVAEREDVSREEAARRVEDGSWTDRPRAAAFVGGPDVPSPPLVVRILDWLRGDPFERHARVTIAEIARLLSVPTEVDGDE